MVINAPRIKLTITAARNFLDLLICTPMPSPKGCMDMPEPMVNRLIPRIKKTVPNMNSTKIPESIDARLTLKIKTIAAMGNTDLADSPIAPLINLTQTLLFGTRLFTLL